jgi:hypothetical protein
MSVFFDLDACNNFQQVYDYFLKNKLFDEAYLPILKSIFEEDNGVHILINENEIIRFTGLMEEKDINFWVQTGWTVYTFTE